jgi:hypothetical protein
MVVYSRSRNSSDEEDVISARRGAVWPKIDDGANLVFGQAFPLPQQGFFLSHPGIGVVATG